MKTLRYLIRNAHRAPEFNNRLSVRCKTYNSLLSVPKSRRTAIPQLLAAPFSQAEQKCWNCGADRKPHTDLLCGKCNAIQRPHNTDNYFKVLDVPEDFDVDLKSLTTVYRRLQAVLHPDKFSNKSDKEQTISADYSALVNQAYGTLQHPMNRAMHMLRLRGEKIEEDQKVSDPVFLMRIMELNEEVEDANTPEELNKLYEKNKVMLEELGRSVSKYFKEDNVEKARDIIVQMKYYNSLNTRINELMRDRGIVN